MSIVVLISGNGSNLQALIDAKLPIAAVISNTPDAFGLQRATQAAIPTHCIDHRDFQDRESFDQALGHCIDQYAPQWIVLAGFMRLLSAAFVSRYTNQIINIHPSLLPKYPGLNTHQRALDAGDVLHGITIHIVTEALDAGPTLAQEALCIAPDDTAETLQRRIQRLEHLLYPKVLRTLLHSSDSSKPTSKKHHI